jgi:hypothetical protein
MYLCIHIILSNYTIIARPYPSPFGDLIGNFELAEINEVGDPGTPEISSICCVARLSHGMIVAKSTTNQQSYFSHGVE